MIRQHVVKIKKNDLIRIFYLYIKLHAFFRWKKNTRLVESNHVIEEELWKKFRLVSRVETTGSVTNV